MLRHISSWLFPNGFSLEPLTVQQCLPELVLRPREALLELVRTTKFRLQLVTPYLKVWPEFLAVLQEARTRGVEIECLVRKVHGWKLEQVESQCNSLRSIGVHVLSVRRLHAKLYANENEVLLTSFNAYDSKYPCIDVGVRLKDPKARAQCSKFVARLHAHAVSPSAPRSQRPAGA
jgi:hypothetical protein